MTDKTYAEFHRDMMNKQIQEQDKEWSKNRIRTLDYYILRALSALIVLACVSLLAAVIYGLTHQVSQ